MTQDQKTVCRAQTINHIAIIVSDLQRSKDWYCRLLSLHVIQENADGVPHGFGDRMLGLAGFAENGLK